MNKLVIIGNLVRDPEMRTTGNDQKVCNFTVAVNNRSSENAEYFRVTAWRTLGENCHNYLTKGQKVAVVGSVSVHTYTGNDGNPYASLEVRADEVEFLGSVSK